MGRSLLIIPRRDLAYVRHEHEANKIRVLAEKQVDFLVTVEYIASSRAVMEYSYSERERNDLLKNRFCILLKSVLVLLSLISIIF